MKRKQRHTSGRDAAFCFEPWGRAWLLAFALIGCSLVGCVGSAPPYTVAPVKTVDPDTAAIPKPKSTSDAIFWDRLDHTLVRPLTRPLDLGYVGRQAGQALGVTRPREADNVNALDEPPASSWYARRHAYRRMTLEELARGPNTGPGPDTSGLWTVTSGKVVGATPGFVIEDARGDTYVLKFSEPPYEELSSAAEVISTKIFYAAGYHVPENFVAYFRPERLRIAEGAMVREEDGAERPLREAHLRAILDGRPRTPGGTVRAAASKWLGGEPVGPWSFSGTRADDPNDRVWHEHRRELRGLYVLSAWLGDTDRRMGNTLAVYTDERYLKRYLLDFGSTLGSSATGPKTTNHGNQYIIDPGEITQAAVSLGAYERPWLWVDRDAAVRYPAVGYFEAELFDPGRWKTSYPNPAFEQLTLRDAFWGAKLVMSFTDEDLRAIVATGQITDPEAEAHLLRVLKARRDKTGRYWFSRMSPLGRFLVAPAGDDLLAAAALRPAAAASTPPPLSSSLVLRFDDLAVQGGLEAADSTRYVFSVYQDGARVAGPIETGRPALPLQTTEGEDLHAHLAREAASDGRPRIIRIRVRTQRGLGRPGPFTDVYLHYQNGAAAPRVAGLRRES